MAVPGAAAKRPTAHAVHAERPGVLAVPAAHNAHAAAPAVGANVPAAQLTHAAARLLLVFGLALPIRQSVHAEEEADAEYEPGAHGVQVGDEAAEKNPAAHAVHDEAPTAPARGDDVPARHDEQIVEEVEGAY